MTFSYRAILLISISLLALQVLFGNDYACQAQSIHFDRFVRTDLPSTWDSRHLFVLNPQDGSFLSIEYKVFLETGRIDILLKNGQTRQVYLSKSDLDSWKGHYEYIGGAYGISILANRLGICFFGSVLIMELADDSLKFNAHFPNTLHLKNIALTRKGAVLFRCYPDSETQMECENTQIQKYALQGDSAAIITDTTICLKGTFYGIRVTKNMASNDRYLAISNLLEPEIYLYNHDLVAQDTFRIRSEFWDPISDIEYKELIDGCPPHYPRNCYETMRGQEKSYSRIQKVFMDGNRIYVLFINPKLGKYQRYLCVLEVTDELRMNELTTFRIRVEPGFSLMTTRASIKPGLHYSNYSAFHEGVITTVVNSLYEPKMGMPSLYNKLRKNAYYKKNNPTFGMHLYTIDM